MNVILANRLKAEKKRDDKGFKKDKCFPHDKQRFNDLISNYFEKTGFCV